MYPHYDADLFDSDGIEHPYPHYAAIRDLGPVVRLTASDLLAVGRYADVKKALLNHKMFVSGQGVVLNEMGNTFGRGTTLMSDPPLHQKLRGVVGAPLGPAAVAELRTQIQQAADDLVTRLVEQRAFDGVRDLARYLPISIVSNLVGLPEKGRANMLDWASAGFDTAGPANARCAAALPMMGEMMTYVATEAGPDQVVPGAWAARIYAAADAGLIERAQAPTLIFDYIGPSLDTTIAGTGHLFNLLGRHPDQWQALRRNPDLIPAAINEAIRLESPIRGFTRVASAACDIDGVAVPEGARLLMLYPSANRDERKWADPDSFDIHRANVSDQIGFGIGRHVCVGQHLARLEMESLLRAMIARVETFTVGTPTVQVNNLLRTYDSLPVRIDRPAALH